MSAYTVFIVLASSVVISFAGGYWLGLRKRRLVEIHIDSFDHSFNGVLVDPGVLTDIVHDPHDWPEEGGAR